MVEPVVIWSIAHHPLEEETTGGDFHVNTRMCHGIQSAAITAWERSCRAEGLNPRITMMAAGDALFIVGKATEEDPKLEERVKALEAENRELISFASNLEANVGRLAGAVQSMMDSRIIRP